MPGSPQFSVQAAKGKLLFGNERQRPQDLQERNRVDENEPVFTIVG